MLLRFRERSRKFVEQNFGEEDDGAFLTEIRTTELGSFCSIPAGNSITRRAAPPNVELGGKGLKLKYQQKNKPLCVLYGLLSALDLYGDSDGAMHLSNRTNDFLSLVTGAFTLITCTC